MHETFSRLASSILTAKLHEDVHVHVASVDQLTYEEFIRSIPTPTCLAIINADPLPGNFVLEIDPAVTFAMIHRLTGGPSGFALKCQHELTDLESNLMEDVIVRLLGALREGWTNVLDFRPRLGAIETNPQFLQIVSPCEMTVLVTLETKVGDIEGMMNICMPYIVLESIIHHMSAQQWYIRSYKRNTVPPSEKLLDNITTTVKARLDKGTLTADTIANLEVDDVLSLSDKKDIGGGLLLVDNHVVASFKEKKAEQKYKTIAIDRLLDYMEKDCMMEKQNVEVTKGGFKDIRIQVTAELGRTVHSLEQIKNYTEGTILELDSLAGEPVNVFANNVLIAKGEVVVIDENFGIRLIEILDQDSKFYSGEE